MPKRWLALRVQSFEIEELMGLGEKYALPVLLYLFRRIERSLQGQPAAIIMDEAWLMLGHEVFREKIREWLKVMRKANCMVIMATQSLTDAARSGILDVIVESTASKVFLPNIFARDEDTLDALHAAWASIIGRSKSWRPLRRSGNITTSRKKGAGSMIWRLARWRSLLSGLRTRSHWLLSVRSKKVWEGLG